MPSHAHLSRVGSDYQSPVEQLDHHVELATGRELLPLSTYSLNKGANYTLTETDNGTVINVTATATITLPATAAGNSFIVRNSGGATINVSPAAADKIMGIGFTSADNKDAINTDGKRGDYLALVGDGVDGYKVTACAGTWTREA